MFILGKKSVGIDIADRSVEAVELSDANGSIKISSVGRAALAPGIVERGEIIDADKLEEAVKAALASASPRPIKAKKIIFGLPESRLFSHLFDLPKKRKKSIVALVEEEAVNNFPIRREDLAYSFKTIEEAGKGGSADTTRILLIGASKETMAAWQKFFDKLGMEIEKFDSETMAISRGLAKEKASAPISIIDIGAAATTISIFNGKGLYYTHTFNQAGDELTRQLADFRKKPDGSKIDFEEAERIKIDYGISDIDDNHKEVARVLKIAAAPIAEEAKAAFKYFFEKTGLKVEQVALVGGTAQLKGIAEFFSADIGSPASVGKPALETEGDQLFFIEAIGLALRAFPGEWDKTDPYLESVGNAVAVKISSLENKEDKTAEPDPDAKPSLYASHPKEFQLALVLVIGAVLIGGAFWYRGYSAKKRHEIAKTQTANAYAYTQNLPFEILINAGTSTMAEKQIRGRIVTQTIERGTSYEQAAVASKEAVVSQIKKGESIWKDPVNSGGKDGNVVFPIDFDWLVYPESAVMDFAINEAKKKFGDKSDFILDKVNTENVSLFSEGTSTRIYSLTGQITVMTKKPAAKDGDTKDEKSLVATSTAGAEANTSAVASSTASTTTASQEQMPASSTPALPVISTGTPVSANMSFAEKMAQILQAARGQTPSSSQVLILENSAGSVNVRAGNGIDFSIIKKANFGEKYPFIEEQSGWIKIRLSDTEEGWVTSEYAQVIGN